MTVPSANRVAAQHEARRLFHEAHLLLTAMDKVASEGTKGRMKTAGEVIFKKDMSGDASTWAYATPGPSERLLGDFNYSPKNMKPLAKTLRGSLAALGHVLSAYNMFAKVKSARISPDGNLGGKGYIAKITDMRKQFMNCVEALSALSDTLYDEVNAPHWSVVSRQETPEEKKEVSELLSDVEDIRDNPEEWAQEQIEDEFEEDGGDSPKGSKKTASVAVRWLEGVK